MLLINVYTTTGSTAKKERNFFATNNIDIKQEKHNIKVSS